jgi:hypothetical protein
MLDLIPTAGVAPAGLPPANDEPSVTPGPFAPLFTSGTEPYALATLDELGRPLAGVYVPDHLLL